MLLHLEILLFVVVLLSTFQVYFPVFIGSSIYLRFLNELVHMLNKDDDDDMAAEREIASRTGSGKSSNRTALKLGHTVMGKDLDDPDSLWERPAFLYVAMQ